VLLESLALSGIPKRDQKVMSTMQITRGVGAGVCVGLTWWSDGVTIAVSSPYVLCFPWLHLHNHLWGHTEEEWVLYKGQQLSFHLGPALLQLDGF